MKFIVPLMRRLFPIGLLSAFLILCVIAGCRRPTPPPLSLIIVTLDTLRADYLGCYGNPRIHTPNLDRLARNGSQWQQVACQTPLTVPSHSAIFTSRYPYDLHVLSNTNSLPEKEVTLAEHLKEQGFATAAFTSGILMFPRGLEQGFDRTKLRKSGLQSGPVTVLLQKADTPPVSPEKTHLTAKQLVDEAIEWYQAHQAEQTLIWLHCFDPHMPYNPARPFRDLYSDDSPIDDITVERLGTPLGSDVRPDDDEVIRALYAAEVAYVDSHVGRLIRLARSVPNPPLIVAVSDHGEMFRDEHGYIGHGSSLLRQEIDIPLIFNYTGSAKTARVFETVSESIDIIPTILNLMRLPDMKTAMGKDLLSMDTRPPSETVARFCRRGVESGVQTNDRKLIHDMAGDQWKLFDLDRDAQEKTPLNPTEVELQTHLSREARIVSDIDSKNHGSDDEVGQDLQEALKVLGYL